MIGWNGALSEHVSCGTGINPPIFGITNNVSLWNKAPKLVLIVICGWFLLSWLSLTFWSFQNRLVLYILISHKFNMHTLSWISSILLQTKNLVVDHSPFLLKVKLWLRWVSFHDVCSGFIYQDIIFSFILFPSSIRSFRTRCFIDGYSTKCFNTCLKFFHDGGNFSK